MRLLALVASLGLVVAPGCKVCGLGACAKDQGDAVTAVEPRPDGTVVITTCKLTTKGTGATVGACRQHAIPHP